MLMYRRVDCERNKDVDEALPPRLLEELARFDAEKKAEEHR